MCVKYMKKYVHYMLLFVNISSYCSAFIATNDCSNEECHCVNADAIGN